MMNAMQGILKGLILIPLLVSCSAKKPKDIVPGFSDRSIPSVHVSQEIFLEQGKLQAITILAGSDERFHLFAISSRDGLRHFSIGSDQDVVSEDIGVIKEGIGSTENNAPQLTLDAIECPANTFWLATGETQYVKESSGRSWKRIENTHCQTYFAFGERLFCAFLDKGYEIATPTRKDVTVGLLLIIPVWSTTEKHPAKLLISENIDKNWIVRAVIDKDDNYDTDPDFLLGINSSGIVSLFYFASRGGGFWWFLAGRGGAGVISGDTSSFMRFARFSVINLPNIDSKTFAELHLSSSAPVILDVKGETLESMPFLKSRDIPIVDNPTAWYNLRPLRHQFSVAAKSEEISGIMWAERVRLDDGKQKAVFNYPGDFPRHLDSGWVSVGLGNGHWLNHFEVVTGRDTPTGYSWPRRPEPITVMDDFGNSHLLLTGWNENDDSCAVAYLKHDGTEWSTPLLLGKCTRNLNDPGRSLSVDQHGLVLATWTSDGGNLVGRILTPLEISQ